MPKLNSEKLLAKFLSQNSICVVDPSPASRRRLMKTLSDLGAKAMLIKTFKSYEEAQFAIVKLGPKIVLSDYKLEGDKTGFDLLQTLREIHKKSDSIFMLITSNSSQSLVAQAAEEDIDSFILKPYTVNTFKDILLKTTVFKLSPPEYIRVIEQGKEQLFSGLPERALEFFIKAKTLDSSPSLACFYQGQAEFMMKAMKEAENEYVEGLNYNKIHYQCLTNLFNLLYDSKRYTEAYDVVKKIAKYFPANPKRLSTVLRLSILTAHYDDIEVYYDIFKEIETRSDELVKYICSALITSGRYYLLNRTPLKALELFSKAKTTSAGNTKYLFYIIQNLIEFGYEQYTPEYLLRFPHDERNTDTYLIAKFLVENHKTNPQESLKNGINLIERKIFHYCVHLTIIRLLISFNLEDRAKEYLLDALKRWPERTVAFNSSIQYLNSLKQKEGKDSKEEEAA